MNNFAQLVQNLLMEQNTFLKGNKKDPKDLPSFITKRSEGAKKIEKSAAAKGGYATLTAIHFKAKEVPYNNCSKHSSDEDSTFVKEKADECFDKLKSWDKMSQREFQHVMGQLEAYGEVYIRSIEDKGK